MIRIKIIGLKKNKSFACVKWGDRYIKKQNSRLIGELKKEADRKLASKFKKEFNMDLREIIGKIVDDAINNNLNFVKVAGTEDNKKYH